MHLIALFLVSLITHSFAAFAPLKRPHYAEKRARFEHEAVEINEKRQLVPPGLPPAVPAEITSEPVILTYVTPSPSAQPIPITAQGQLVTSYIPQITVCALPPLAFESVAPTGPPYLNYSVSIPTRTGSCLTTYSPTITPICHTVLTGIASRTTVTDCTQEITFSSDVDFIIETPDATSSASSFITPAPYVRLLETYYAATWTEFATPGVAPSNVDVKICTTYQNGTTICMEQVEAWYVETVTLITSTTTHIDLTTTVKGPALVMVETYHMDVTGAKTTISLSTKMGLEYEFQTLTTIRESGASGAPTITRISTLTNTITKGVAYNTDEPSQILPTNIPGVSSSTGSEEDQFTVVQATRTLPGETHFSTLRNWNSTT
ncbi:hypothetical protein EJ08DRAFT_674532 [Tothia fuscella]|uniref:Uncharacterized protein n=1 Tax=Tothia fuscella TaxID=1048955 RepID=A0A9P4U4H4_9PEZI|nr:hypothetical protein EJ08DRAFT_674532 [Tothia fuscella]